MCRRLTIALECMAMVVTIGFAWGFWAVLNKEVSGVLYLRIYRQEAN